MPEKNENVSLSQKNIYDYMIVIITANEGGGAGIPHEMTQAQPNHTKKLPISAEMEYILGHVR